ncbi:hypothetical protein D3C71_1920830 [compost metagenome]
MLGSRPAVDGGYGFHAHRRGPHRDHVIMHSFVFRYLYQVIDFLHFGVDQISVSVPRNRRDHDPEHAGPQILQQRILGSYSVDKIAVPVSPVIGGVHSPSLDCLLIRV